MTQRPHRRTWLRSHGLTVIFAVAYVFLSLLVLEQGRTIQSQRQLIRALFHDSVELTHLKAQNISRDRP